MAAIVVFTRYPEPGKVKTRLIPALGPQGAADLHRRMTLHTLRIVASSEPRIEVRFAEGDVAQMRTRFGDHHYQPQGDGDLGARMARAFDYHFRSGEDRVVIIGTDCPALTPALLREAFDALARHDLALGPATDGGYYLIGLSVRAPPSWGGARGGVASLFTNIDWGTDRVLAQSLDAARRLGLSTHLLRPLCDVDRPEDLPVWRRHNEELSVILPTLNEESHLPATLERVLTCDVEVIVADGGSTDTTVSIAHSAGVNVLTSARGRAQQMNAGAAGSLGGRLLFCHADTLLPPGYDRIVRDTLADPDVALGAFSFHLAGRETALRRIEAGANFRSRRMKLPYGDQALFLRRETFERLGGFILMSAMEDFDLVRRAAKLGRIVTVNEPAITSPRRWHTQGIVRTMLRHQAMIARYYLGI